MCLVHVNTFLSRLVISEDLCQNGNCSDNSKPAKDLGTRLLLLCSKKVKKQRRERRWNNLCSMVRALHNPEGVMLAVIFSSDYVVSENIYLPSHNAAVSRGCPRPFTRHTNILTNGQVEASTKQHSCQPFFPTKLQIESNAIELSIFVCEGKKLGWVAKWKATTSARARSFMRNSIAIKKRLPVD